jgi:hypothetical protein
MCFDASARGVQRFSERTKKRQCASPRKALVRPAYEQTDHLFLASTQKPSPSRDAGAADQQLRQIRVVRGMTPSFSRFDPASRRDEAAELGVVSR